jgi:glycosyltransferase involved in cell wall biosynthesis
MTVISAPKVSVLLPALNGAEYIHDSISSLLKQTYKHFELIVIDGGSTDGTIEIVRSFHDERIKLVIKEGLGLPASLNLGIELATGKYLARQDADDLSHPNRFQKQVEFLESNPDYGLLGTHAEIWLIDEPTERSLSHPAFNNQLQFLTLFDAYFVHGSIMARTGLLRKLGGYTTDPARQPPEDYELWSRVIRETKVANISECLYVYREIPSSLSRNTNFRETLVKLSAENLAFTSKVWLPNHDIHNLSAIVHGEVAMLKGRLNFKRMRKHLEVIAAEIDKKSDSNEIGLMAKKLISDLTLRYDHIVQAQQPKFIKAIKKLIFFLFRFLFQKFLPFYLLAMLK